MTLDPGPVSHRSTFEAVPRDPSLVEKVTAMLLDRVLDGRLTPGMKLPPERVLGEQFGVSRTVIREAIRALQAKGVIDIGSGRSPYVTAVDAGNVSQTLRLYLSQSDLGDVDALNDVRRTIELRTVELAAANITDVEIEQLTGLHRQLERELDDVVAASRLDVEFHRALAAATHNPLYVVLLDALAEVLLEIRLETLSVAGRPHVVVRKHAAILAAVAVHNEAGARDAMANHLQDSADALASVRATRPPGRRR